MIKKPYTTIEKLEAFLQETVNEEQAEFAINSAIDMVEKMTNRIWVADAEASPRFFGGTGTRNLGIDECVEVTEVRRGLTTYYADGSEVIPEGTDFGYFLYPINSTPIRALHLRGRIWSRGWGNNRITARWGAYEEVPDDISFATTILAGGLYNFNGGGASGQVQSERIGNYSVAYGNEQGWRSYERAKTILNSNRKWLL